MTIPGQLDGCCRYECSVHVQELCTTLARVSQTALYTTYLACHASKSTNSAINIDALAAALQKLHDHLLQCLRRLVEESITDPEYSLALTNTFIALGNDSFLDAVCNDKQYSPDRDLILTAARLLLIRFEHPDMVPLPRRNCTVPSCLRQQVYHGMCSRHASHKYRTMFAKPTFQSVVRSPDLVGRFNAWVVARANGISQPLVDAAQGGHAATQAVGPQPQLPSHLHPHLLAFHRAVEQFHAITSRDLRTSRARTVIDKYLVDGAHKHIGVHLAPPHEVAALEGAVDRAAGMEEVGSLPSLPHPPTAAAGGGLDAPGSNHTTGSSSINLAVDATQLAPHSAAGVPALRLGLLPSGAGAPPPPMSTARLGPGAVSSKLFAAIHARVLVELDALFQHEFVPSAAYVDLVASVSAAVLGTNSRGGRSIRRVTNAQGLASMLWTADIRDAEAAQGEMQAIAAQESARRTGVQAHQDSRHTHPFAGYTSTATKK